MRPKRDGLNIVPFIDVMLVLLAIVLSVSTFIAQGGIKVELANSKNAVTLPNIDKALVISVDDIKCGQIFGQIFFVSFYVFILFNIYTSIKKSSFYT